MTMLGKRFAMTPRRPTPPTRAIIIATSNRSQKLIRLFTRTLQHRRCTVRFRVRSARAAKTPPLSKVRAQAEQQYAAQRAQRAQIAFQNELQRTWRPRTVCAKGHIVPQCSNGPALPEQPLPAG